MDVLDEYEKLLGDDVWMPSSGECPESLLKEMEHIRVPQSPGVPVGNTQQRHTPNPADALHLISSQEDMNVRSRKLYRSKRRRRRFYSSSSSFSDEYKARRFQSRGRRRGRSYSRSSSSPDRRRSKYRSSSQGKRHRIGYSSPNEDRDDYLMRDGTEDQHFKSGNARRSQNEGRCFSDSAGMSCSPGTPPATRMGVNATHLPTSSHGTPSVKKEGSRYAVTGDDESAVKRTH
ncbi:hypothetical protein KC19_VG084100 [Ceratodon purpureus]|uniref:Uncharacterized protein n=1 Tax=Ceratodon purpureus TaxID=3225 RepID=A0A8T0HN89_CERPU|nr:hypothetical protein KC19_VG084100 [Ceratodon purpureus]